MSRIMKISIALGIIAATVIALTTCGCVSASEHRKVVAQLESCAYVVQVCQDVEEFERTRYDLLVSENDRLAKRVMEDCK